MDSGDDDSNQGSSTSVVSLGEAKATAHDFNLDLDSIPGGIAGWRKALNIEMEHGKQYSQTDITGNSVSLTAKIVLAHLKIDILYYERLGFTRQQASWEASRYPGGKPKPIYKQLQINNANRWNRIRFVWTQRWAGLHAKLLEITKGRLSFKYAFPFAPGKPNTEEEEEEEDDMRWDWAEQFKGPGSEREFVDFVRTFDANRMYALIWTITVGRNTKLEMKMYQVWWFYLTMVAKAALGISIDSELTGKQASRLLLYDTEVFRKAAWEDVWLANLGWKAMPTWVDGFSRPNLAIKPMSGIWELNYQENYLATENVPPENHLGALWIAQDRAFRFDMNGIAPPVLRRRWVYFWYVIVSRLERLTGKPWIRFSTADSLRALITFERGLSNLRLGGYPKDVIGTHRDVTSVWSLLRRGKSKEEPEEEEEKDADITEEFSSPDDDDDEEEEDDDFGDDPRYQMHETPYGDYNVRDNDDDIPIVDDVADVDMYSGSTEEGPLTFSDDDEDSQATQPLYSQGHWDPIEGKRKRDRKKKGKEKTKTKEKKKKIKGPYANTRYVNGKPRNAEEDAKVVKEFAVKYPGVLRGTTFEEVQALNFTIQGRTDAALDVAMGHNIWVARFDTQKAYDYATKNAWAPDPVILIINTKKLINLGYWDTDVIRRQDVIENGYDWFESQFKQIQKGMHVKKARQIVKRIRHVMALSSTEASVLIKDLTHGILTKEKVIQLVSEIWEIDSVNMETLMKILKPKPSPTKDEVLTVLSKIWNVDSVNQKKLKKVVDILMLLKERISKIVFAIWNVDSVDPVKLMEMVNEAHFIFYDDTLYQKYIDAIDDVEFMKTALTTDDGDYNRLKKEIYDWNIKNDPGYVPDDEDPLEDGSYYDYQEGRWITPPGGGGKPVYVHGKGWVWPGDDDSSFSTSESKVVRWVNAWTLKKLIGEEPFSDDTTSSSSSMHEGNTVTFWN